MEIFIFAFIAGGLTALWDHFRREKPSPEDKIKQRAFDVGYKLGYEGKEEAKTELISSLIVQERETL
jgi:hypothetical protein